MKKNSGKAPSYQMYPKDWNEDAKLKMCSYRAQGLWIRLINTSYDMPEKGVFRFQKRPLNKSEILNLLPGKNATKRKAFDELVKWDIIKQFDDKSFYCKRLYKDMRLRDIRKAAGKKGGNPNLVGDLLNQNPNQSDKQNLTPSSSTSSSTSVNNTNTQGHVEKFTLKQCEDNAYLVGLSDEDAGVFYDRYNSQGWIFGNGNAIMDLRSAMSYWKKNEHKHEFKNKSNGGFIDFDEERRKKQEAETIAKNNRVAAQLKQEGYE